MIKFKLFGFNKESEKAGRPAEPEDAGTSVSFEGGQNNPNGKRVLIVDDDAVFLRATAMKFQAAGLQVATARESSEAIAALSETPADAILMDIEFPPDVCNGGMGSWDGFQLMTWLRGMPTARGARFFMVSNSDSPEKRKRARDQGAMGYFTKPLNHEQLLAAVNA